MLEETGQALLVLEVKALVARVDVDSFDAAVRIKTHGAHEAECVSHAVDDALVLLLDGGGYYMAKAPVKRRVQIGKTGRQRSPEIV